MLKEFKGICASRQCHGHGGRHHHRCRILHHLKSLVDGIIIPPIGVVTGGVDFSSIFIPLNGEHYDSLAVARHAGAPTMNIGLFINNVISFVIVVFVLFMVIKAMNQLHRKQEEDPASEPPPSREVELLTEIRDALVKRDF
jgi:large conductance mechanosensitive channel